MYYSHYYIRDSYAGKTIYYNTLTGDGFYLNVPNSKEDADISNPFLYHALKKLGILVSQEDYQSEHLIVERMHYANVFDTGHMSLTILPTDACNLRCIYCYQSEPYHFMSEETEDAIVNMIRKEKSLRSLHISWFGGEPLCNKGTVFRLMERIDSLCREKHIALFSDMTTNATLLDVETFKRLIRLRVLRYQVTIDGPAYTHNLQRPYHNGTGSYDQIITNLCNIRDQVKSQLFSIGIRTNFSEFVHANMGSFVNDLSRCFSDDKRFYFFYQWVKDWGGCRIESISSQLLDDNTAIRKYGYWMDVFSKTKMRTGDIHQISPCSGLCVGSRLKSYIVDTYGALHKCTTAIYDDAYKGVNNIGQITSNGDIQIDPKKEIQWILKMDPSDKCRECNQYPICNAAPCPLARIKNNFRECNRDDHYIRVILRSLADQNQIPSIDQFMEV